MLRPLCVLPIALFAGLIAGGRTPDFLAAAIAAAAAEWLRYLRSVRGPTVYANLDPLAPDGTVLIRAFAETIARARQTSRPLRLRIAAFVQPQVRTAFEIDVNRQGDLEVRGGPRTLALKQPGVWLADHPLPLALPHDRCLVLDVAPCGETRVRASTERDAGFSYLGGAALAVLAASACALDFDGLLAAVLGFAAQTCVPRQQPRRAHQNAGVQRA